MAKISSKSGIILINGYNVSSNASQYTANTAVPPNDVTGFTDGWRNNLAGTPSSEINLNMVWNATATNNIIALVGSAGNLTIVPEGWTLGNRSLSMGFLHTDISNSGDPSGPIQIGNVKFSNYKTTDTNEGIENGWILAHDDIETTQTGTGFVDPSGGAVTARCSATLHIWTACASDTYAIEVQHSTTLGSGYATLVAFTMNGSAIGSERVVVASGTINKYRRVLATVTGSAGNTLGYSVHFWHA